MAPWFAISLCLFAADAPPVQAPSRAGTQPASAPREHHRAVLLWGRPLVLRLNLSFNGRSLADERQDYVERLFATLDSNGDGMLTRDEAQKSPLLRTRQRESAKQFLESLGVGDQKLARDDVARSLDRFRGESVTYRQDSTSAAPDKEVFKFLDRNSDGVIDQAEQAIAGDALFERDEDLDQCVTFEEFVPPAPAPDPLNPVVMSTVPAPPPITTSTLLHALNDPALPRRLLSLYDRNSDKQLSPGELRWTEPRVKQLDANGDGRLSVAELANLKLWDDDVELVCDLAPSEDRPAEIQLRSLAADQADAASRADFSRLRFPDVTLTIAHRRIDPVAKAVESAMRVFNRLDLDANGYLEPAEVKDSVRFERGLFDQMDGDGDGKVFAEEVKQYVTVRVGPVASTCRLNIYDAGFGFFLALDANADGRISERERRAAQQSLHRLDRDGKAGVTESEPVRHLHLEVVRGSYSLFGASESIAQPGRGFQRLPPSGPAWFQAMDRNNDGDLSWEEFQASRLDFDRIDRDGDGLIDGHEAALDDEEYRRKQHTVFKP